jgi:uncharacterized protein
MGMLERGVIDLKKIKQNMTVLFTILFPLILLSYEYKLYKLFFALFIIQLLSVTVLSIEKSRLFMWCLNTLLFCFLLILYAYPILEGLPLTRISIILTSEGLQLVPIVALLYIHFMFKQKVELNIFEVKGVLPQVRYFFISIPLIIILLSGLADISDTFFWLSIYGLLHAVVLEILWRGILLPLYIEFWGVLLGILVNSITFCVYLHSFGFSFYLCFMMMFVNIASSFVRIKTTSISPSIFIHFMTIILLYFTGGFVPPV